MTSSFQDVLRQQGGTTPKSGWNSQSPATKSTATSQSKAEVSTPTSSASKTDAPVDPKSDLATASANTKAPASGGATNAISTTSTTPTLAPATGLAAMIIQATIQMPKFSPTPSPTKTAAKTPAKPGEDSSAGSTQDQNPSDSLPDSNDLSSMLARIALLTPYAQQLTSPKKAPAEKTSANPQTDPAPTSDAAKNTSPLLSDSADLSTIMVHALILAANAQQNPASSAASTTVPSSILPAVLTTFSGLTSAVGFATLSGSASPAASTTVPGSTPPAVLTTFPGLTSVAAPATLRGSKYPAAITTVPSLASAGASTTLPGSTSPAASTTVPGSVPPAALPTVPDLTSTIASTILPSSTSPATSATVPSSVPPPALTTVPDLTSAVASTTLPGSTSPAASTTAPVSVTPAALTIVPDLTSAAASTAVAVTTTTTAVAMGKELPLLGLTKGTTVNLLKEKKSDPTSAEGSFLQVSTTSTPADANPSTLFGRPLTTTSQPSDLQQVATQTDSKNSLTFDLSSATSSIAGTANVEKTKAMNPDIINAQITALSGLGTQGSALQDTPADVHILLNSNNDFQDALKQVMHVAQLTQTDDSPAPMRVAIEIQTPPGAIVNVYVSRQNDQWRAQLSTNDPQALTWVQDKMSSIRSGDVGVDVKWLPPQMESSSTGGNTNSNLGWDRGGQNQSNYQQPEERSQSRRQGKASPEPELETVGASAFMNTFAAVQGAA